MSESDLESKKLRLEFQSKEFTASSRKLCNSISREDTELTRILEQQYRAIENDDDGMTSELRCLQDAEERVRREVDNAVIILEEEDFSPILPKLPDEEFEDISDMEIPSIYWTSPASTDTLLKKTSPEMIDVSRKIDLSLCATSDAASTTISDFTPTRCDGNDPMKNRKLRRKAKGAYKKKSKRISYRRPEYSESSDSLEEYELNVLNIHQTCSSPLRTQRKKKTRSAVMGKTIIISSNGNTQSCQNSHMLEKLQSSQQSQNLSEVAALFVQMLVGEEFVFSFSGIISLIARLAFGRHEYVVEVFFHKASNTSNRALYARTYEGSISVFLSVTILIASFNEHMPPQLFWSMMALIPLLFTMLEIKIPHRIDETIIAFCALSIRFIVDHFITRYHDILFLDPI